MSDRLRETALGVHTRSEAAGRDKSVNALARSRQQVRVTPKLRRAFSGERAAKTLRLFARPAVELPEHVCRTDQPVFVRRVEFHGARMRRIHRQNLWAEQRDVMKMDHIIRLTIE